MLDGTIWKPSMVVQMTEDLSKKLIAPDYVLYLPKSQLIGRINMYTFCHVELRSAREIDINHLHCIYLFMSKRNIMATCQKGCVFKFEAAKATWEAQLDIWEQSELEIV